MLVLSRRSNEKIVIGLGDAKVTLVVIDIDRGRCRIGIEAPRSIPVHRSELMGEWITKQVPCKEAPCR